MALLATTCAVLTELGETDCETSETVGSLNRSTRSAAWRIH